MTSTRVERNRKVFKQYKEDVKDRGKSFYPFAMLHDSIMSGVVVSVIIGLAVVWKYTTPGHHTGYDPVHHLTEGQDGWLGKLIDEFVQTLLGSHRLAFYLRRLSPPDQSAPGGDRTSNALGRHPTRLKLVCGRKVRVA